MCIYVSVSECECVQSVKRVTLFQSFSLSSVASVCAPHLNKQSERKRDLSLKRKSYFDHLVYWLSSRFSLFNLLSNDLHTGEGEGEDVMKNEVRL